MRGRCRRCVGSGDGGDVRCIHSVCLRCRRALARGSQGALQSRSRHVQLDPFTGKELLWWESLPSLAHLSRLTWLAQDARERFEELTPEAIAKAAADTQVCVSSGTTDLKVQAIVLVPRSIDKPTPKDVIKPNELSVDMVDMYNKLGGQWKEANYTACFPHDLNFQNLDVLVVYANNSRSHETLMNKADFPRPLSERHEMRRSQENLAGMSGSPLLAFTS